MLIQPSDFQDFQTHIALLMDEFEFRMPDLPGLDLPQLDFSRVETEWQRIWQNIPEPWKLATDGLEFTVGEKMATQGLSAKHPVVLIPGIISTVCFHSLPLTNGSFIQWSRRPFCRVWSHGQRLLNTVPSSARSFGAGSQ